MEPAGSPEFCVICAPGTLPCNELSTPPEPLCTKSLALTVLMALPSSRRLVVTVEPTTTTSSRFWRLSASVTLVVTVSAPPKVMARDSVL